MTNSSCPKKIAFIFARIGFSFLLLFSIAEQAHATDLKLLSWNIFMLPKPIKNSLQKVRAKVIAQQLSGSDYDLMFFQEAFTDMIRNELVAKLGDEYPYRYYLKRDGKLKHVFGSGLFIMSRHPFKVLDRVYFKKCGAFDCYAAKGSVLIEAMLPSGKVVQFAPTHLQAKEALGSVRLSQLQQMKTMLLRHARNGVPQIIMGDLNIDVVEPEFESGLNIMDMSPTPLVGPIQHTNGRINDCYKSPGKNKEWIDHFWVSNQTALTQSEMEVRDFEFPYKGRTCPSSDHHAVEARISLE